MVSLVWLLNHDLCADDAQDDSPACASTCMPTRGSVSLHLITLHAASSSCGYGRLYLPHHYRLRIAPIFHVREVCELLLMRQLLMCFCVRVCTQRPFRNERVQRVRRRRRCFDSGNAQEFILWSARARRRPSPSRPRRRRRRRPRSKPRRRPRPRPSSPSPSSPSPSPPSRTS